MTDDSRPGSDSAASATGTATPARPASGVSRLPEQLYAARRRARERWRRLSVTITVTLLLLSVLGYVLVCHSPLFALRSIHVAGTGGDGLSAQRVTQAAALPLGAPLTSLDTAGAQARIERIPQVASARVAVEWPHTVRITVTTRVAAALIPNGSTYDEVDTGGVVFGTVPAPAAGLPVITVQGGPAVRAAVVPGALAALSALGSTAPAIAGEVTGISASSAYSIMLRLSGGVTVTWGGSDAPALKARDLAALMRYRKASAYNVSAPDAPSVS